MTISEVSKKYNLTSSAIHGTSKYKHVMKKANGKYKKINTTTKIKKRESKRGIVGITSSNKALRSGVEYSFKARTFRWVKTKKVYSKWSNTVTIIK